jgi:glycosyltransferase involved in cell wall biosynthesis
MTHCSVLICIYKGDKPEYFREAVRSVLNQTVKPNEIIVVVDGMISDAMAKVLGEITVNSKIVKVVRLPKNVGVGAASNEGLKHCKNELVAKMDADDVAVPNRLELQLAEFKKDSKLVLLGGQIAEFSGDVENIVSYRRVPTTAKAIRQFARRRSPFNNQTVMYKKSAVLSVGGYPKLNRAEDYYLFSKLIVEGYKVKNLSSVLVLFRLDDNAIERRRTWKHTKEMIRARNEIKKLGLASRFDVLLASVAQVAIFVTPPFFAKWFYRRLRK